MLLTIAMPAFDEAPNLEWVAAEALAALDAWAPDGELLIVDDGSTDGTGGIADRIASNDARVRVIHHQRNRGFSGAMTTSVQQALGDWIFLVPADGQVDMRDLARFLEARGEADIVVGVRTMRADGTRRALMSRTFHWIAKLLFPVPLDEMSSAFLFRRSRTAGLPIRSRPNGATFLPELLYRAHARGARFVQLRITPRRRLAGRSKGGRLLVALVTLFGLLRLAPLVRWDELRARGREPTRTLGT